MNLWMLILPANLAFVSLLALIDAKALADSQQTSSSGADAPLNRYNNWRPRRWFRQKPLPAPLPVVVTDTAQGAGSEGFSDPSPRVNDIQALTINHVPEAAEHKPIVKHYEQKKAVETSANLDMSHMNINMWAQPYHPHVHAGYG